MFRTIKIVILTGLFLFLTTGILFGQYIGSDDYTEYGGSRGYPKAQAFIAPASEISHVALYMINADGADSNYTWRVLITTGLPKPLTVGDQTRIDQSDLNAKTVGTATVTTSHSNAWSGWVDVYFSTPVPVTPGRTYYLFIDSYTDGIQGSSKQWRTSARGAFAGPYADGIGWIYVYHWTYNSNYQLYLDQHVDYAFRVYYTPETANVKPTANAGTDAAMTDSDKNGTESVSFNGSASSDSDGTIQSYIWKQPAAGTTSLGTFHVSRQIRLLAIDGNYAYLTDAENGLHIVDISDPSSPVIAGHYYDLDFTWGVAASGNYAYVTANTSLKILDVSNPAAPSLAGSIATTSSRGVALDGNYAYVADGTEGLKVINIANPASPSLVGSANTPGTSRRVTVRGDYAYVGDYSAGLWIIDISNPSSPTLAGSYNTTGLARGVAVNGKYAYVADSGAGLKIIDVSDPNSPSLAGTYNTPGYAWDVEVVGNYAYVGDDASGLQIIDVSDPASPSIAGVLSTETAYGVVIHNGLAYVGDNAYGLQIVDVSTQIATGATTSAGIGVGTHTISLTVTDNQGAEDTDTVSVTVKAPPTASAGGDQTVTDADLNGLENVTLNGSASTDIDGIVATYIWRKGGSQIATGATPSVSLGVGIHFIELTVTDDDGLTDSDTVEITIDSPPTVSSLLSNGLPDPNNLSDFTPTFSWVFADADSGDAQESFDIRMRVQSSPTFFWNHSDDTQQQNVTYNGTTDLLANTTYIWSVRVWDNNKDHVSAWEEGEFTILDIGLRAFDGTEVIKIAVDYVSTDYPVRIHKDGVTYGVVLVDPGDSADSGIFIQIDTEKKAIKKME